MTMTPTTTMIPSTHDSSSIFLLFSIFDPFTLLRPRPHPHPPPNPANHPIIPRLCSLIHWNNRDPVIKFTCASFRPTSCHSLHGNCLQPVRCLFDCSWTRTWTAWFRSHVSRKTRSRRSLTAVPASFPSSVSGPGNGSAPTSKAVVEHDVTRSPSSRTACPRRPPTRADR